MLTNISCNKKAIAVDNNNNGSMLAGRDFPIRDRDNFLRPFAVRTRLPVTLRVTGQLLRDLIFNY